MKINKKLAALMMTFVIGGTVLTGCGQKVDNNTPQTEQGTTQENQAEENQTQENQAEENQTEENQTEATEGTEQGADQEESFAEEDPTVAKETVFVITDGIELPATMDMPEEMFQDSYGIDTDLLASYTVMMPLMNVHAAEIAVFEVKDEANIEAVKEGIAKRQAALETQWSSYLPDQYELVKNAQTVVKGNLVLFVINEAADQMVQKFQA